MSEVLVLEGLTKRYGAETVVDSLSFTVPESSLFGFIGRNGAGKTTTMRMVLGLLKADAGRIQVCGEPVRFGRGTTNRLVGYLPDVPEFYGYMRPREYLQLCGEVAGMSHSRIKKRSDELLTLVGLESVKKRIGGFSRGMKQRLGIAQALLAKPKLLICDEPTSALDPLGRNELLNILRQVRTRTTVVFSTHILSDVERLCDRIAMIDKGRLILTGSVSELKARHGHDALLVEFATPGECERFCLLPELAAFNLERTSSPSSPVSTLATPLASPASPTPLASPASPTAPSPTSILIKAQELADLEAQVLYLLSAKAFLPIRFEVVEPTIENLFLEAVR